MKSINLIYTLHPIHSRKCCLVTVLMWASPKPWVSIRRSGFHTSRAASRTLGFRRTIWASRAKSGRPDQYDRNRRALEAGATDGTQSAPTWNREQYQPPSSLVRHVSNWRFQHPKNPRAEVGSSISKVPTARVRSAPRSRVFNYFKVYSAHG